MKNFPKYFFAFLIIVLDVQTTLGGMNFRPPPTVGFDSELYESVLDPEQCARQLSYIRNNDSLLRFRFMDASWRIPRHILQGNFRDMGSYFDCLEINEDIQDMNIGGKYCAIEFPLEQEIQLPPFPNITWPGDWNITWPGNWNITFPEGWNITWPPQLPSNIGQDQSLKFPWQEMDLTSLNSEEMMRNMNKYEEITRIVSHFLGVTPNMESTSRVPGMPLSSINLELAVCIPKACTSREALDSFTGNITSIMEYSELFCRLPNDKTWAPVDTVAIVLLSTIGFITIISTAYDLRHTVILGRDSKEANKIYQTFSIYTNTKNFFNFPSGASVVTCLDGVRSFAMMWVIIGHTFMIPLIHVPANVVDMINAIINISMWWLVSAPITVDTFFVISGLLIVYTTAAKLSRRALIKNLHLFYLNRLLRMFPVLAFSVLMLASFFYRLADGPYFQIMTNWVNSCRANWWLTFLYVQNFFQNSTTCLPHTWYLAVDMQLHILSPLVLFWVLGQSRRSSWIALCTALIGILIATSIYNFTFEFHSNSAALGITPEEVTRFMRDYYFHTFPRSTPFFVGMVYGYILHIYRRKTIQLPILLVLFLWLVAISGTSYVVLCHHWNVQPDWDNQLLNNIFNSYNRPLWAACVGWIIFACHKGYGGPINWLLSLYIFKILGRLSYAMYILHYPLIFLVQATALTPTFFAVNYFMYKFVIDFSFSVLAAFLVMIFIDAPFGNLIKMALDGMTKTAPKAIKPDTAVDDLKTTNDDNKV